MVWTDTVGGPEVVFETEPLPAETLSPLASRVDDVLAAFGYELGPAIDAIDDAVEGFGGLFAPATTDDQRRRALATVADDPPAHPARSIGASEVVLYVDGSSRGNPGPAGAGAVVVADGTHHARLGRPIGAHADNNLAEFAGLHLGLAAVTACGDPTTLEVRIDSTTVIDAVWGADDPLAAATVYADAVADHLGTVPEHDWTHLADSDPNPADAQATVGADIAALGPG